MKKIILSFVFVFIVSFVQAQEVISCTAIDTCRAQVVFSEDESIEINPEPSKRWTEEVWGLVLKDLDFKNIEEVRAHLDPYDFHSVDCFLDAESRALVFCFEKVIKEEIVWKKEQ
jgi:hypothetical protein